ncbi:MAG: sigma 54-interacting transcriptional regulator [Candidatus Alcyoniella australis]|nr:sigma 54-interacting transcriptional regulator [Candidatus Alcyoniella australis]
MGSCAQDRERIARLLELPIRVERAADVKGLTEALDRGPMDMLVYVDSQGTEGGDSASSETDRALRLILRESSSRVEKLAFVRDPYSGPAGICALPWGMDDEEVSLVLNQCLLKARCAIKPAIPPLHTSIEFCDMDEVKRLAALNSQQLSKLARSRELLLLIGETGVGKRTIAKLIHRHSGLPGSLVEIDLSSVNEEQAREVLFGRTNPRSGALVPELGVFDLAEEGTLIVNLIDRASVELLSELTRCALEQRYRRQNGRLYWPARCRMIFISHITLGELQTLTKLPEPLQAALKAAAFSVPPLRERMDDLGEIAEAIYGQVRRMMGKSEARLPAKLYKLLSNYFWPGNMLELAGEMQYLASLPWEPTEEDVFPWIKFPIPSLRSNGENGLLQEAMDWFEAGTIKRAMFFNDNRVDLTAEALGMPISTFKYRLARLRKRTDVNRKADQD